MCSYKKLCVFGDSAQFLKFYSRKCFVFDRAHAYGGGRWCYFCLSLAETHLHASVNAEMCLLSSMVAPKLKITLSIHCINQRNCFLTTESFVKEHHKINEAHLAGGAAKDSRSGWTLSLRDSKCCNLFFEKFLYCCRELCFWSVGESLVFSECD